LLEIVVRCVLRELVPFHQVLLPLNRHAGSKDPGEFVFDVPAEAKAFGFSVEPPSGNVAAGQKVCSRAVLGAAGGG
jgi:hypothetical protein